MGSFECSKPFIHNHLLESGAVSLKETMMETQSLPLRNLGPTEEANSQGPVHGVLVEKGAGHEDDSVRALA